MCGLCNCEEGRNLKEGKRKREGGGGGGGGGGGRKVWYYGRKDLCWIIDTQSVNKIQLNNAMVIY